LNAKGKIGITLGGIIGIIAIIFIFTNIDGPSEVEKFASDAEFTNQANPSKINTECELVNYLNDEKNTEEVLSFIQSNEDQFQARFSELGGGQTTPPDSQSAITDGEIAKIVFADMAIEEFSINHDLKNFLIVIQEDSPQNLIERVKKIDPNCTIKEGFLNPKSPPVSSPLGAGPLGSDHSHAGILVKIFGDSFDFSAPAYQIKASWIHFEGGEGTTIHKHATGVTLGYLFDSLSLGLDDQCFEFQNGRSFCTNEDYSLRFFINGDEVSNVRDYEIVEDDKILISYGAENAEEIESQLLELESQSLMK
jgi:hypothetical protein